ncbi:MAG: apolipoprotein N-acyltransferase [Verrucomicrobia bacterium]|nr:apolipoprotein N-acyltransferase [Verrucomicrobiota bacterium]
MGNLGALRTLAAHGYIGRRALVAVLAGVLWAMAFAKPGIAGLAWIAPGVMLAAAAGARPGAAFRFGYLGGLAFHLVALYWLLWMPAQAEPGTGWASVLLLKLGPAVAWLSLSAFLALYPACWVWLSWRISPVRGTAGPGGFSALVEAFLEAGRVRRLGWAFACAALWVALEMVQARLLTGFPWNLLGASQAPMLPLIQVASLTGVYGVSFLVVWFSVSLLGTAAVMIRQPVRRESWMLELLPPLLCAAAAVTFGMRQLRASEPAGRSVTLTLIQPSIPQTTIWNPAAADERFRDVIRLSEEALDRGRPDILVWPEAAVPSFARWDTNIHQAITNLVRRHAVWLVLGSDDLAPAQPPRHDQEFLYFNSAFLVRPDGEFVADYRKRRLVVFGEFVPLERWLPFLKHLTPLAVGFTPGTRPVPFRLPDLGVQTSVLICFEDVFPHLARDHVEPETDFLLNLTNNGWFGESAAQWQHAANAVFRAVENGLPLVRCANNGLSCLVDARGRMSQVYFPGTRDIYGAGFKSVRVPILAGKARAETLYHRHGDWFGWGCAALGGMLWAMQWATRGHRRERQGSVQQ